MHPMTIILLENFAQQKSFVPNFKNLIQSGYIYIFAKLQQNFSYESLNWLNHCALDDKFGKTDGSRVHFHTVITGEKILSTPEGEWTVDGYAELGTNRFVYEFFGCR